MFTFSCGFLVIYILSSSVSLSILKRLWVSLVLLNACYCLWIANNHIFLQTIIIRFDYRWLQKHPKTIPQLFDSNLVLVNSTERSNRHVQTLLKLEVQYREMSFVYEFCSGMLLAALRECLVPCLQHSKVTDTVTRLYRYLCKAGSLQKEIQEWTLGQQIFSMI